MKSAMYRTNPAASLVSAPLWHGTSDKGWKEIRADKGVLRRVVPEGRYGKSGRSSAASLSDRVYVSTDPFYAAIYAVGANVFGSKFPKDRWDGSRYGWLLRVVPAPDADLIVDEDQVGQLAASGAIPWLTEAGRRLGSQAKARSRYYGSLWMAAEAGEYMEQIRLGKLLIKAMTPGQMRQVVERASQFAIRGRAQVVEAWRIDKSKTEKMRCCDPANIFDNAKLVSLPVRMRSSMQTSTMSNPVRAAADLGLAEVEEYGKRFATGEPVTFDFFRGTEPAPKMGARYQQNIEPAGRYMTHLPKSMQHVPPGMQSKYESGSVTFANPLVLRDTFDPDQLYGPTSWKARLSGAFKAKGKRLSAKVAGAGYDGIVTVRIPPKGHRNPPHTGEIVDLTWLHKANPVTDGALDLQTVLRWEPEAARRGVSKVARSRRGFVRAYETAGDIESLGDAWERKRDGFIRRHVAQAENAGEPWFEPDGSPTRRHLALIMWAYSPVPGKLAKPNPTGRRKAYSPEPSKLPRPGNRGRELRQNPVSIPSPQEMGFYSEGACDLFAYALAKVFGYTPIAMRYYFPDGNWTTPHVFAVTDADVAIDAGGSTTLEEIAARDWHLPDGVQDEPRLVRLTPDAALNELRNWPEEDVRDAVEFVRRYSDFYRDGSAANPVAPIRILSTAGGFDMRKHPDADSILEGEEFELPWRLAYVDPASVPNAPTLEDARKISSGNPSLVRLVADKYFGRQKQNETAAFAKEQELQLNRILRWLGPDPRARMLLSPPIVLGDELLDGWHRVAAWLLLGLSDEPMPLAYASEPFTSNPVDDAPDWLRFAVERAEPRIVKLHGRKPGYAARYGTVRHFLLSPEARLAPQSLWVQALEQAHASGLDLPEDRRWAREKLRAEGWDGIVSEEVALLWNDGLLTATAENEMYKGNPTSKEASQAVVEYAHKFKLRPNMKGDEARALIRAYLRALGLREDGYGNFKDPAIPTERVHFSTQRVQHQQKNRTGWSNVESYKPVDWARTIVKLSARAVGDTELEDRFAAGQQAAKKRKAAAESRLSKEKVKDKARMLAQKQFGMDHPDVALNIGTGKLYTGPKFDEMKVEVDKFTDEWLARIEAGKVPADDSAFATIDKPPMMPVFFNAYVYDWIEKVDGVDYSVHIQHGGDDTAIVTIGAHGQFTVDPQTHRMSIPNYKPTGDAQVTGRVIWTGEDLAGVLFLAIALNKQKGAGTRVMQLWCRLMQGYGIEAWIAEAVGDEGMGFIKALERKGSIAVLGGDPTNLIVGCLKPMLKKGSAPKRISPAPKRSSAPKAAPPKRGSGPTSYLVEMMEWDKPKLGMQIEDRKQRVKLAKDAAKIAVDFMNSRPRTEHSKIFITPMRGRVKLHQPAVLIGERSGWHAETLGAMKGPEQQLLHDAANEATAAARKQATPRPDLPELPEGFEGFDYFNNPVYQDNPPWADKMLVKDWEQVRKAARRHKMPMPVREGTAKNFAELGCGHYGCVYATKRDDVVFKLTSDPAEIEFVKAARKIGEWPAGIVHYYAEMPMSGKFRKRAVQGLWREAAVRVGLPAFPYYGLKTNDDRETVQAHRLLEVFKHAASMVRDYATKHPDKVRTMDIGEQPDFDGSMLRRPQYLSQSTLPPIIERAKYRRGELRAAYGVHACKYIAETMSSSPILYGIGEAMLFYMAHGILMADVHANNVGQVVREENMNEPVWVITDPGHAVAIPPVWSYLAEAEDKSAMGENPVRHSDAYSMGVSKPTAGALNRWATQARKVGLSVTTRGNRGVATGTSDQWEEAKLIQGAPDLVWVWDEALRGPATHDQVVRRSGVWWADANGKLRKNPTGGKWAYHVTYYNRLEAVADRGLLPVAGMHGSAMGKGGYAGHTEGKLFLTEEAGVPYWYGKAEDFANHSSDDVLAEGYTPVVLRVPMPKTKKVDEAGSRDSMSDAWYVKRAVKPDKIELWTGDQWVPVDQWERLEQSIAYDFDVPEESLMGIPEEVYLKADYDNPLVNFGTASSPRKRIGL